MENTHEVKKKKRTFWNLFFRDVHLPPPEDSPDYAESYMVTETVCVFGVCDRLRILVSGKLRVTTHTKTDVIVKKSFSTGSVCVLPPNFPMRKDGTKLNT